MLDLFREIDRRQNRGERVAVATIVRTTGSTPRELGAKMVVTQDGKVIGSIGGGYGEHEVWKAAAEVVKLGQPRLVHVELTSNVVTNEGAVCGGAMDIFVEPIGPSKT
ncbi:MAG: XdhC family protein [Chloroflexota bacterium]|jgi:xanthine/CO dehydrogenase XdhC/CoxF family maturation factor